VKALLPRDELFALSSFGFARFGLGSEASFAPASVAFEREVVLP
jgi:hypothetical protein